MDSTTMGDDEGVEELQNALDITIRLHRTQIDPEDQEQLTDQAVKSDGRGGANPDTPSSPHTALRVTEGGADIDIASSGAYTKKVQLYDEYANNEPPLSDSSSEEQFFSLSPQADGVLAKKLELSTSLTFVEPRPFKTDNWEYEPGILKAIESGDYMLRRAVEFKFQARCRPEENEAYCSFLSKSFEFVGACLNSRKNGTIYFGIADGNSYGEIHGIEMDQSLCAKYYETFHKLLPKCFPDNFELVRLCLAGPYFVLIKNTNRWIIEIDIEPAYKQTKEEMFCFNQEPIREKYWTRSEKKAEKKKNHTGFFRRDGSETQQIDQSQVQCFKMGILPRLAEKRKQEDDAHRFDMKRQASRKI